MNSIVSIGIKTNCCISYQALSFKSSLTYILSYIHTPLPITIQQTYRTKNNPLTSTNPKTTNAPRGETIPAPPPLPLSPPLPTPVSSFEEVGKGSPLGETVCVTVAVAIVSLPEEVAEAVGRVGRNSLVSSEAHMVVVESSSSPEVISESGIIFVGRV